MVFLIQLGRQATKDELSNMKNLWENPYGAPFSMSYVVMCILNECKLPKVQEGILRLKDEPKTMLNLKGVRTVREWQKSLLGCPFVVC